MKVTKNPEGVLSTRHRAVPMGQQERGETMTRDQLLLWRAWQRFNKRPDERNRRELIAALPVMS
jgi:hypothetical protein